MTIDFSAGGTPVVLVLSALLLTVACAVEEGGGEGGEVSGDGSGTQAVEFAPELGVDLDAMERRPTGLYVRVLEEGEDGPAVSAGDRVSVHYTGWLPDGREFDSSRDGEPLVFNPGTGQVIAGWDEGVLGMTPGERRRLVIPPELGYGPRGAGGVIPPDATLVFEVEVLAVEPGGA